MTAVPLSVVQIETASLTAWPALQQAHDGLWLWRYARGFTKRANSIQCLDAADGDYAEYRLRRLADLSERHGIAPLFRVTPLTPTEVVEVLEGLVWEEFDQSLVMAMEMPNADFPFDAPVKFFEPNDPTWYRATAQMSGYDGETTDAFAAVLEQIPCEARGILTYHKAGLPVASTLVCVWGGIGVYLNVVTHPNARGKGYGRAVMSAALNWARSAGAIYGVLSVMADNQPALKLYNALGFGEVYSYSYRRAPDWSEG